MVWTADFRDMLFSSMGHKCYGLVLCFNNIFYVIFQILVHLCVEAYARYE